VYGLPHGLTFAAFAAIVREDVRGAHHVSARRPGHVGGGVGRPVIDDHQLVDQAVALHQLGPYYLHDSADGGRLIAGRNADR
jgi:hypothetical protein